MTSKVKPIPEGYSTLTPYLILNDATAALDFYKKVFGAVEKMRMGAPGGKIGHAEITIGDSNVMLADEMPQMGFKSPVSYGGTPVSMALYVEDCDAMFAKAVEAGAKVVKPLENQFYGDRSGTVIDPWGHVWTIGTHIEDVSPEEMQRRLASMPGCNGQ